MGCNESREDKIQSSVYSLKTPLPLHLYLPRRTTLTSLTPSPNKSPAPSPTNKSPTNSYDAPAKTHLSKLNSIAHFKFPMFREFQSNVQQEILHHIDRELQKQ